MALEPIETVFHLPTSEGRFEGELGEVLEDLSLTRKVLVLAFAPKAAGTFFRSAAIDAVDGRLARMGHAQGGRDVQPYLPTFVAYYLGYTGDSTFVMHAHLQALPANRHFFEALDIRPIIMVRAIPDMLASYRDMLDTDEEARREGLNCKIPDAYLSWTPEARAQFLIDVVAPWYASYFATWLQYAREAPIRVCTLFYPDFVADPAAALHKAVQHAGFNANLEKCRWAIENNWKDRQLYRFNRGVSGRGKDYFSPAQLAQIERMLGHYGIDGEMRERLMGRFGAPAAA